MGGPPISRSTSDDGRREPPDLRDRHHAVRHHAVAHPLVPNARAVSPDVEDRIVRLRETLACLPSSRAGLTVEDTITSSALDLVAQCDRVIAAKGGLFSAVG